MYIYLRIYISYIYLPFAVDEIELQNFKANYLFRN